MKTARLHRLKLHRRMIWLQRSQTVSWCNNVFPLLSETDREILIRHANGETYAALANAYGYKTAGGMQKRIARIKKQVVSQMGTNAK